MSKKLISTVGIAVPENHVRQYLEKGPWRPGPNFRWPNKQRFTKGNSKPTGLARQLLTDTLGLFTALLKAESFAR